jgi:hypothetical protein
MHLQGAMAFLDLNEMISWKGYVLIGVFALIILVSVFMSRTFSTGVNIHVRKKITVIFITLIGSVVLMLLCADTNIRSLIFLCFPMSVLMAAMFLELDPQFAEILHFLLLVMALVFQYIV